MTNHLNLQIKFSDYIKQFPIARPCIFLRIPAFNNTPPAIYNNAINIQSLHMTYLLSNKLGINQLAEIVDDMILPQNFKRFQHSETAVKILNISV